MNKSLLQKLKQDGLRTEEKKICCPKKKFFLNFALFNKLIFTLAIVCGLCYIFIINDLSIKGIVLENLKNNVSVLNEEKKNYELAIMRLESYDNINRRAQEIKMVKVDKIEYISAGSGAMAKK